MSNFTVFFFALKSLKSIVYFTLRAHLVWACHISSAQQPYNQQLPFETAQI